MNKEIFSKRLKQRLIELDMTQADLARACGTYPTTIGDYVKGRYAPKLDRLEKIASVLNVSVHWLIGEAESQHFATVETNFDSNVICLPVLVFGEKGGTPRDTVPVIAESWEDDIFAARIPDDSMAPRIAKGDIGIFKKCNMFFDDEIMLLFIKNSYTVRNVRIKNELVILESFNCSTYSMYLTIDEIKEMTVIPRGILQETRINWK